MSGYLRADERRAATVESLLALAAEQNPSDITTTAIARRMGLTQGALFKHFPTREAIVEAVMASVAERLMALLEAAAEGRPPLQALEAMFLAHAAFVADHPGVPRLLFGELQRAEPTAPKRIAQTLLAGYAHLLVRVIERGQGADGIDPAAAAEDAAALFIGTLQGLVMQSLLAGSPEAIRERAPAAFALYRRALEVRP